MPRIYRAMDAEGDRPVVANSRRALGVLSQAEVQTDQKPDVVLDAKGLLQPQTGGMSVAPSVADLPPWRIPKRLQPLIGKAAGSNELRVFAMGAGRFLAGALSPGLALRTDSPTHGLVEPASPMTLERFRNLLAATRDQWAVDEEL